MENQKIYLPGQKQPQEVDVECVHSGDYALLLIPKNAGNTIGRCSTHPNISKWDLHKNSIETLIVLLRDPLERWISGTTEWIIWKLQDELNVWRWRPEKMTWKQEQHLYHTKKTVMEDLDSIGPEQHTAPQTQFLCWDKQYKGDVKYHMLNKNTFKNLEKLYSLDFQLDTHYTDRRTNFNTTEELFTKQLVKEWLVKFQLPKRKEKILEFYKDDYNFIKKNKFF